MLSTIGKLAAAIVLVIALISLVLPALGASPVGVLIATLPRAYALRLIVLALFGGQARDPSALGVPYTRA